MRTKLLFFAFLLSAIQGTSQELYFPPTEGEGWETLSPESLGWCTEEIPELYDYLDGKNTKAFLVLKDGKIVLEKYFDTFTADSLWYWASAGKCITSVLTGIAQQEGMLSLTDPTSDYLGEGWTSCTPEQEATITVWNQVTMTSGLDDGVEVHCTDPECLFYLADAGERWAYHNGPYTLLSEVIENASGLTFNGFCNNYLEAQTGMSGFYLPIEENKVYFSVPRDMARFGLMILNEGYWDTEGVLTDSEYFNSMINTSQSLNEAYGYLWWLNGKPTFMLPQSETVFDGPIIPNAPYDMIAALGKNDQILNVVPSQNLIVVRMGENPGGIEDLVPVALNNTIWDYLNGIMCEVSDVSSESKSHLTLYPNPSTEMITIRNNSSKAFSIQNIAGQEMMQGTLTPGAFNLNIGQLETGVYFLTVENETIKFVVQ